jgi:hypothetical protein
MWNALWIFENIWFIAAFWMGLALLASLISIRLGISVALIEIVVGVIVGNIHFGQYHNLLRTTEWTNFLAMLGSGVLTFLAGAEIDPASLRANPAAVPRGVAVRAVRAGLAAAPGVDCGHRPLDDLGSGGLCGDDRGWPWEHGDGQDAAGGLLHH